MNIPFDIHTHQIPEIAGGAILNCVPNAFMPQASGWYSVGIHPWNLSSVSHLKEYVNHSQVLAVGEAGLDKLADSSINVQMEMFEYQARLAMEVDKPLIIHVVKAKDELMDLRVRLRPSNPWIIHGFRGKVALAQEYLRHGFYLSFGAKFQEETLRMIPSERLFLETDESEVPIGELYERAATVRGCSSDAFRVAVQENVRKVFFKK